MKNIETSAFPHQHSHVSITTSAFPRQHSCVISQLNYTNVEPDMKKRLLPPPQFNVEQTLLSVYF